jgi:hypothetical protein
MTRRLFEFENGLRLVAMGRSYGEETQDLPNLRRFFRSGRRSAIHESRSGSLGFEDERV